MVRIFDLAAGGANCFPRSTHIASNRVLRTRTGVRVLGLATAGLVFLSLLVTLGCDDNRADSARTICCGDGAGPIFLQSKSDDDDGDGNLLDEDFPTINDEDDDIADHTWIQDGNGVYHLFFHNEGLGAENEIEHYIWSDVQTLDYVGIALRTNPSGWDAQNLWAPHIVKVGNTYFMFYTGVEGRGADAKQRIGVATSIDLTTWMRVPINNCPGTSGDGCIYQCDESWTTWGQAPGSFNQQCRDPFVIWDAANQRWVMFITAKSTNQFGVVTVAYSTDLTNWTGAGYINATRRLATGIGAQTTGGQAENPFVMSHKGTRYLLFSDWQDPEDDFSVDNPRTMVQYVTSSSLVADSSGSNNWTYHGYIPDPGVGAIEVQRISGNIWIMSQSISNVNTGDHPAHRRELRLKCVAWGDNLDFDTSNVKFPCGAPRAASPMAVEQNQTGGD